jgi:hypothetical protein
LAAGRKACLAITNAYGEEGAFHKQSPSCSAANESIGKAEFVMPTADKMKHLISRSGQQDTCSAGSNFWLLVSCLEFHGCPKLEQCAKALLFRPTSLKKTHTIFEEKPMLISRNH